MTMEEKQNIEREEDEFSDDEDEMDNEQLETSLIQKFLSPFYLILLVIGVGVAIVPFLILYTVGWMIYQASTH
ncbi:MAG: hypothetical protein JJU11_13645 [Candidatus Sumerlaeia bacterium]|nr:hypothetical protein [Candidatus Sumerlaeia bacterium]